MEIEEPIDNHLECKCVIKNNIVFSESESCPSSPLSVSQTHSLSPMDNEGGVEDLPISPLSIPSSLELPMDDFVLNAASSIDENTAVNVALTSIPEPASLPLSPKKSTIIISPKKSTITISPKKSTITPTKPTTVTPTKPITVTPTKPTTVTPTYPTNPPQETPFDTPIHKAIKRPSIVCNESPAVTPSKIVSLSTPALVTPSKPNVSQSSKTIEVSPTKVVLDEDITRPVLENKTIVLTARMKRLLNEQNEERNRFRLSMKQQTNAIQQSFERGLSRWNGVGCEFYYQ